MTISRWMPATVVALLVGCVDADQPHPLESVGSEVTRAIPTTGGYISTPAGAAVYVAPESGGGTFTLAAVPTPPELAVSGWLAGPSAFRLDPAARDLAPGSRAELRIPRSRADSLWLSSVVRLGAVEVVEHGATRVDLALGIVSAEIEGTGTFAAVIPAAGAVVPLASTIPPAPPTRQPTPAELAMLFTIDSLTVDCGVPGRRCSELVVAASENLLGRVKRAALVYPRLYGVLRREDLDVVGFVEVEAAFRVELGATAENVTLATRFAVRTSLAEAALSGAPTGPLVGGRLASVDGSDEERITVYPPREGEPARAVIEKTVQVPDAAGVLQPARIHISFPFEVHTR